MPNISDLVTAISNDVVAKLAAAGYPPLVEGQILFGRFRLHENAAPPRIIMIPMGSSFDAKDPAGTSNVAGAPSPETRRQVQQRSVKTDAVHFEIRVWGVASPPDPIADFDITQAMYQQVIASTHLLAPGCFRLTDGEWQDSIEGRTQLDRYGAEFVFGLTFFTPVLDQPLPYAPSGTRSNASLYLQPADGSPPELAATGV